MTDASTEAIKQTHNCCKEAEWYLLYNETYDEWFLLRSGGDIAVTFCPWCATRLPKRNEGEPQ